MMMMMMMMRPESEPKVVNMVVVAVWYMLLQPFCGQRKNYEKSQKELTAFFLTSGFWPWPLYDFFLASHRFRIFVFRILKLYF